jgi:hypothetical protein
MLQQQALEKNKQNNADAANILTFDASSLSASSSSGLCRQHQHGMCQGIDVITQFTREVPRYCFQAHKAKKKFHFIKKVPLFFTICSNDFKKLTAVCKQIRNLTSLVKKNSRFLSHVKKKFNGMRSNYHTHVS